MKKFYEKLKKFFDLNTVSLIYSIAVVIVFVFLAVLLACKNYEFEKIISIFSNYISIVSIIYLILQVVSFVKDSKLKEQRSRKEYALELAKEYAEVLLPDMAFINIVLALRFNDKNVTALEEELSTFVITEFTSHQLNKNKHLKKHEDYFVNGINDISYDLILERAVVNNIDGFDIKGMVENYKLKSAANIRFKLLISTTLNRLEYFSMSVNQNVAESDMLFDSLHQTFIQHIKYVYPFICDANCEYESYYTNVIKLYRNWTERMNDFSKLSEKERVRASDEYNKKKAQKSEPPLD